MLFNSFEFILLFLPLVLIGYYLLNRSANASISKIWLVFCSLFFYSWWNISYLPLLLISIIYNYCTGILLGNSKSGRMRFILAMGGVVFNIALLGYYKYWGFIVFNTNTLFNTEYPLLHIALPLAISFFTFQQIAYLVDCYRGDVKESSFLNYMLFITFFPQLIAGPIVHHKEMMPQFDRHENRLFNFENQAKGVFIFSIGLFKKVILADTFAIWSTQGFNQVNELSMIEGWVTALSFVFQLYFDFSGYMDMAMGAALFFNIKLPLNFNSPYKALDIQEAWNRWHMTLGRFLYQYVYIPMNKLMLKRVFTPLGMKKQVMLRTNLSLILLFLISGIWHGAGWTFITFGLLHGIATVCHRIWKKAGLKLPRIPAWFLTFGFIVIAFTFFRAASITDALKVLSSMFGLNGIVLPVKFEGLFAHIQIQNIIVFDNFTMINMSGAIKYLIIGFILVLCCRNSVQLMEKFKPNVLYLIFSLFLLLYSLMNLTKVSEFLYFNF